MPLWMSSGELGFLSDGVCAGDVAVDLSRYVAFQAADRFSAGVAFGDASSDVVPGSSVPSQARECDRVESGVRCSVAAAVESTPVGLARGGFDGADSAEGCEGGLAGESVAVIARGQQEG